MRTLYARRASHCRECGQPIERGAEIGLYAYQEWGHVECARAYRARVAADDLDALTYGYGSL
jgi:hypothetical protein